MVSSGPRVTNMKQVRSDDRKLRVRETKKKVVGVLGLEELLKQVEQQRFHMKSQKIDEHLKEVGVSLYYRQISSSITTKLVSKCSGERVLTLRQKQIRNLLRIAEDMRGNCNGDKQEEEGWTKNSNLVKRVSHEVDLATKLVNIPLHHTQDTGGPLTEEEEQMSRLEKYLLSAARRKMPPRLESLLKDKLMERFGPSFGMFVRELVLNITMLLFMPWHRYLEEKYHYVHLYYVNAYFPTEEDLLVDLRFMFRVILPRGCSTEDVVEAIVKKIELGFVEVATPEDKLTLAIHKMSLAQPQD